MFYVYSCLYKANPSLESIRSMDLARKKTGGINQLNGSARSWQEEASFCIKLVKDLQKLSRLLGREEVAKSIGSLGFRRKIHVASFVRTFYCC